MLVLLFYLCPSTVRVVATFSGTVLFPLLCSVLLRIEIKKEIEKDSIVGEKDLLIAVFIVD